MVETDAEDTKGGATGPIGRVPSMRLLCDKHDDGRCQMKGRNRPAHMPFRFLPIRENRPHEVCQGPPGTTHPGPTPVRLNITAPHISSLPQPCRCCGRQSSEKLRIFDSPASLFSSRSHELSVAVIWSDMSFTTSAVWYAFPGFATTAIIIESRHLRPSLHMMVLTISFDLDRIALLLVHGVYQS